MNFRDRAERLMKDSIRLLGQERARRWLESPTIFLLNRRPVDVMTTPDGLAEVEELLGRMVEVDRVSGVVIT